MSRILTFTLTTILVICLSGCSVVNGILDLILPVSPSDSSIPGRMVSSITVEHHPENPDLQRCYTEQDTMSSLLRLFREMPTNEVPAVSPDLSSGISYFQVTATYSSGGKQHYYFLGNRYMKVGDEPWCLVEISDVMKLNEFLQSHPTDSTHPQQQEYSSLLP